MPLTRVSVKDYEQMIRKGDLTENDSVELINGEIIPKMPIGDQHIAVVNRLNRLLTRKTGDAAIVSVQNPIQLDESQPEPDIALCSPRADFYESGKPGPVELLLVIEVADSSLEFDREVKLPMYARGGIREYWLVNLIEHCVEVYRQPQADGTYADTQVVRAGQAIDIKALPGVSVAVGDFL